MAARKWWVVLLSSKWPFIFTSKRDAKRAMRPYVNPELIQVVEMKPKNKKYDSVVTSPELQATIDYVLSDPVAKVAYDRARANRLLKNKKSKKPSKRRNLVVRDMLVSRKGGPMRDRRNRRSKDNGKKRNPDE